MVKHGKTGKAPRSQDLRCNGTLEGLDVGMRNRRELSGIACLCYEESKGWTVQILDYFSLTSLKNASPRPDHEYGWTGPWWKGRPSCTHKTREKVRVTSPNHIPNQCTSERMNRTKTVRNASVKKSVPLRLRVQKKVPRPGIRPRWWRSSKATDSMQRKVLLRSLLDDFRCKMNVSLVKI